VQSCAHSVLARDATTLGFDADEFGHLKDTIFILLNHPLIALSIATPCRVRLI
jgi:hypothetical protein